MNASLTNTSPHTNAAGQTWRERLGETDEPLRAREPLLWAFGLLLLVALLPAAIALGFDERVLRGANVWVKPMKFMASVGLLAFTTAWFFGHLAPSVRRSRAARAIVWTVIAAGGFEVAYISLQAGLGEASHFNVGDPFHATMYTLMGLGALALTATQPALAWLLWKHGERRVAAPYRAAVIIGLALTFVLGAGAGMLLSAMQPPSGPGLPIVGWVLAGGDLRIAHFIGIHASQVLPALGAIAVLAGRPRARTWVVLVSAAWATLWLLAFVHALAGRA